MAKLLDGREIAERIKKELIERLKSEKDSYRTPAKLVSISVEENAPSQIYAASQKKLCEEFDIIYIAEELSKVTSMKDIKLLLDKYNSDPYITGVMVQLPLPESLDYEKIIEYINPKKDVEGLHPTNIGRFFSDNASLAPCTPAAIMELLRQINEKLRGKEVVIIGHSKIVGKPLSIMLLNEFATVTVCHIATSERKLLEAHVERAEILISAVGKKGFQIPGEWIRKGAVVIDVATKGDVDFEGASKRASYITPVPGGVGPVTNIMLLKNLLELYRGAH